MELSHEDSLRLNVLLAQNLQAIRIDESAMVVYALTSKGEARVELAPNCSDDKYLRQVRELFSSHALDSPGGYPVYIERWTRMGQTRTDNLPGLLLLGEPEAIVAVANASGLTEELARLAWWAMPTEEIARCLLENHQVSNSDISKELAHNLLEFIPFETDTLDIVNSVRLVLQPDLINESERKSLWARGRRKSAFYLGFLQATPDALFEDTVAHPQWQHVQSRCQLLCENNNVYALQLCRLLSSQGQSFLTTIIMSLDNIYDQDAVVVLFDCFGQYFCSFGAEFELKSREFTEIHDRVEKLLLVDDVMLMALLSEMPQQESQIRAMLTLAFVGEKLADPIFAKTDAVGSVMRKKLLPVTEMLLDAIKILQ